MRYVMYKNEELVHSLKGSSWKDHKYIDKVFKNGKWLYIYKSTPGSDKGTSIEKPTVREYSKINKNGTVTHYKEYTTKGNSWLSKRREVRGNDNHVTVYKQKGKIAQHIEKNAAKGKSFIESLTAKANKLKDSAAKKKKKKSNIKVTHTTYLK